jgi:pyruvate/2-oxoglutarate dehydrogenase complex dihydrolipoamide dehydrogenase (E3) component
MHFGTRARRGYFLQLGCAEGPDTVISSHLLLAVGRRPNTDDLALDKAGIAFNAKGYIEVDDFLQTSVPDIWALGDCNGRGAFTPTMILKSLPRICSATSSAMSQTA